MSFPVVLDTDTAQDDRVAIQLGILDPVTDLSAVIMIAGNVSLPVPPQKPVSSDKFCFRKCSKDSDLLSRGFAIVIGPSLLRMVLTIAEKTAARLAPISFSCERKLDPPYPRNGFIRAAKSFHPS